MTDQTPLLTPPRRIKRIHPTLPVFALPIDHRTALYTPGHVLAAPSDWLAHLDAAWNKNRPIAIPEIAALSLKLEHHARLAVSQWESKRTAPFEPECLIVYISNRCNCRCTYCFTKEQIAVSDGDSNPAELITDEKAISSATDLVLTHCCKTGRPFRLVIHGGGEPTVHMDRVRRICALTRRKASESGVSWWGYVATNGVMTARQAQWLGANIDMVGLSCDGPPEIHNAQRPLANGEKSFPKVMSTAKILHAAGTPFTIRSTITKETINRQKEIATFLIEQLYAQEIRFEPVYDVNPAGAACFSREDAFRFANGFLEADAEVRKRGGRLIYAGLRPDELHGPYCNLLRAALHVIPPAHISACFFTTSANTPTCRHGVVGGWHARSNRITIDHEELMRHKERAQELPPQCLDCANIYHCSRGCPQVCRVLEKNRRHVSDFHCHVALRLITSRIYRQATNQPHGPDSMQAGS